MKPSSAPVSPRSYAGGSRAGSRGGSRVGSQRGEQSSAIEGARGNQSSDDEMRHLIPTSTTRHTKPVRPITPLSFLIDGASKAGNDEADDDFDGATTSPFTIALMIINTIIAACFLAQPYIFHTAGIAPTIANYIVINIGLYTGVEVLLVAASRVNTFDYAELAVEAFGDTGWVYVDVCIVAVNFGTVLANILTISSLVQSVLDMYGVDATQVYYQQAFISGLVVSIIVLPLCLIRNFGELSIISVLGLFTIASVVFLILIDGPLQSASHADDALNWGDGVGTFTTMGSVVFNFFYTMAVFHAYNAMASPGPPPLAVNSEDGDAAAQVEESKGKAGDATTADNVSSAVAAASSGAQTRLRKAQLFLEVAAGSSIAVVCLSLLFGLGGYLSFRDDTKVDILENIAGSAGAAFRIIFALFLTLDIPLYFLVLRHSLLNVVDVRVKDLSTWTFTAVTVLFLGFVLMVAMLLQVYCSADDTLEMVLDLNGALAGSAIAFVLPGLIALALVPATDQPQACTVPGGADLDQGQRHTRVKAYVLVVAGVVIPLIVIAVTIYKYV